MDTTPNLAIPIPDADPYNLVPQLRESLLAVDAALLPSGKMRMFNADDHGAVGNGIADDSTAINNTAAELNAAGGGVLYLPKYYRCTSPITSLINARNIIVRGVGGRDFGGASPLVPSGLVFDVASTAITTKLIDISGSDSLTFEHLEIVNANATFGGQIIGETFGQTAWGPTIRDCFIGGRAGSLSSFAAILLGNVNYALIERVQIAYSKFGIANFGGTYSNAITIRDCWLALCSYWAIANPRIGWAIENCTFEPKDFTAAGPPCGIGCRVDEDGVADGTNGLGSDSESLRVTGNQFWDNVSASGIWCDFAGTDLVFENNTHIDVGSAATALRLRTTCNNVSIRNNGVFGTTGSKFIDNYPTRARNVFYDSSNFLHGDIVEVSDPKYLLPTSNVPQLTTSEVSFMEGLMVADTPASVYKGRRVFDTDLDVLKYFDGAAFQTIAKVGAGGTIASGTIVEGTEVFQEIPSIITPANVVGGSFSSNVFTKSAANGWNAGFSSVESIDDGILRVLTPDSTKSRMIGLSTSDPNQNYTSIQYAWAPDSDGILYIYESGILRGTNYGSYTTGVTVLEIERIGTTLTYYKDGVSQRVVTGVTTNPLIVDASVYTNGSTLGPVELGPALATPSVGEILVWGDGNDHRFHDKDSSGVIGTTVVASPTEQGKVIQGVSAAGVISKVSVELIVATFSMNLNIATVQDAWTNNSGKTFVPTQFIFRNPTPGVFTGGSTTTLYAKESATGVFLGNGIAVANATHAASYLIAYALGASNVPRTVANGAKVQVQADLAYGSTKSCSVDIQGYFY